MIIERAISLESNQEKNKKTDTKKEAKKIESKSFNKRGIRYNNLITPYYFTFLGHQ